MRLYLQARPGPNEAPKYLQLTLQQDLLGGWNLIKESGLQGGKIAVKREFYLDLSSAQDALTAARDQQVKKGFQIMFAEGEERPAMALVGAATGDHMHG
jgi:hypothetical protein